MLVNHFVELIVPYGYLIPVSSISGTSGITSIGFMGAIIATGEKRTKQKEKGKE